MSTVIIAVRSELDKTSSQPKSMATPSSNIVLMECLAELYVSLYVFLSSRYSHAYLRYTANRQPGKALPFYLRLRRPNVLELIREYNLFTDVQDQVLLLVEFDHELMEKRKAEGVAAGQSEAINLLVDNIHSIPVSSAKVIPEVNVEVLCADRARGATAEKQGLLSIFVPRCSCRQRSTFGFRLCGFAGGLFASLSVIRGVDD